MLAWGNRCGQKASEKRLMRSIRKAARGMSFLPLTAGEDATQVWRLAGNQRIVRNVVPQRIKCH
jgi:hypothetical protein